MLPFKYALELLVDKGLAKGGKRIKILGDGELTRKLTVKVHAFSASGSAEVIVIVEASARLGR